MRKLLFIFFTPVLILGIIGLFYLNKQRNLITKKEITNLPSPTIKTMVNTNRQIIDLPQPKLKGEVSVEEAIVKRRSRREFSNKKLSLEDVSQILWAAQGVTDKQTDFRSIPSAGALYPLELYLVIAQDGVTGLNEGVYHYLPQHHKLELISVGDFRYDLSQAGIGQSAIIEAPVNLLIVAQFSRTTSKYGQRGENYVYMEAGHAAQNVYLQATALAMGTVTIGAFYDQEVIKVLGINSDMVPLYIMPIGYPTPGVE